MQLCIFLPEIFIDQSEATCTNRPKAATHQAVGYKELIVRIQDTAPDIIYASITF